MPLNISYEPPKNRDLNALALVFRERLEGWLVAAKAAGYEIRITETRRTLARQQWLYSLGRTRPGKIVTWTLESRHRWGLAADIVIVRNGKAVWDSEAYRSLYRVAVPTSYNLRTLEGDLVHLEAIDAAELIGDVSRWNLRKT